MPTTKYELFINGESKGYFNLLNLANALAHYELNISIELLQQLDRLELTVNNTRFNIVKQ